MIGIHVSPGSFSDRWIEICLEKGIPFKRLNCLSTHIVEECSGLEAVLWHWNFNSVAEQLVARPILTALETKGVTIFPNLKSCWHFDDKVAQKYLLEAIGAPLVPTWVFTDQAAASAWVASATWPKVFKLRCGAGSSNVRLVYSRGQAEAICRRAFGRGFQAHPSYLADARTRMRKTRTWDDLWQKMRRAPQTLVANLNRRRRAPRQQGYVYFQEFLPANEFDTRITIIGQRAFGFLRHNRPNDFRASGSGQPDYDPRLVDRRSLEIAFQVAERLGTQSLALDLLFDPDRQPRIGEVSYCFCAPLVQACTGYWDRNMGWHEGHFWPQDAILEDLLTTVRAQKASRP